MEWFPPTADGNKYRDLQPDGYAERETMEHTALDNMSPSNPSPQSSGNPVEEEAEETEKTEGTEENGAL